MTQTEQAKHRSPLANILTYGLGLVVNKGVALIMLPIMANYLVPAQIGRLDLLASIGAVTGIVITFALHEALYRFVGEEQSRGKQFQKASQIFTVTCLVSFLIATSLFLFINWLNPVSFEFVSTTELNLLLVCASLEGILGLSTAWLRMQDKAITFLIISVGATVLQIGLILTVLFNQPSVELILACGAATYTVQAIALLFINRFSVTLPNRKKLISYLSYGGPLMLTALVGFSLNGAERFFVAYSTDLNTLGQYAIAIKFSFAMCILVQPFGMWWMPKRFKVMTEQGYAKTSEITQLGIIYITALTVSIAFAAKAFILLALPDAYLLSAQLVIGTLLFAWFKEVAELLNIGILYKKKTKLQLWISTGSSVLGLLLMWTLGQYGVWGIVFALVAAQATKAVCVYIFSQQQAPLPYLPQVFMMNIGTLVLWLLLAFNLNSLWGCLIFAALTAIISVLPAMLFRGIQYKLRSFVISILMVLNKKKTRHNHC